MPQNICKTCGFSFETKTGRPPANCYDCKPKYIRGQKKELTCERCSQTFLHGVGQPPRWCPPCRLPARAEQNKQYRVDHEDDVEYRAARLERSRLYNAAKLLRQDPCNIEGCQKKATGELGMCSMHYVRHRKGVDMTKPPRQKRNNINAYGYVMRNQGERRRLEHRIVMERHLGRALAPWENVHHLNGIRHDNDIDNLQLWVTPQPKGQRPEDLAQWVIDNYRPLVQQILRGETPHLF